MRKERVKYMFDFVSDVFWEGNYDEIECMVDELEGLVERGKERLAELTHKVKYTWTIGKYHTVGTNEATFYCKEEDLEEWVEDSVVGELYDAARNYYNEHNLKSKGINLEELEDDFTNPDNYKFSFEKI
jgi:hypothetical protein